MKNIFKKIGFLCTALLALSLGTSVNKVEEVNAADGEWTLVTDAKTLSVEDKIIIAAKNSNVAMSTTQNSNNRGQVAVTKNNSNNTITYTTAVQELTLKAGKTDNTFAFYTGQGYLYAASSSKNYLKTETTLSNNSSWSISIAKTGVATVKAQGSNTRNWMRYNSSNNPPIFSCYSSGQADICLYKLIIDENAATELEKPVIEISNDGVASWNSLEGASGYTYKISGGSETKTTSTSVKLTEGQSIVVKANGDGTEYSDSEYSESVTYNKVETLLNKYLSDGKYIKYTNINIDSSKSAVKNDFVTLFHDSVTNLDRITYYDGNELWMTNTAGDINSGYGTEGELMTHFTRNLKTGEDTVDYRVNKSHLNWNDKNEDGMEGFYVTPNDFLHDDYSFDGWKIKNGQYVFENIVENRFVSDFINIVAPLLLEEKADNYFTINELVIKEVNNSLVLQIVLDKTSSEGTLLSTAGNVLAEAKIVKGEWMPSVTVTRTISEVSVANGWTNGEAYNTWNMDDNITVTGIYTGNPQNKNSGKYYDSGVNWRIYDSDNGVLTFNASEGYKILYVNVTFSGAFEGLNSGENCNVNSNTVTFKCTSNAKITSLTVVYAAA